jgi:CubicO group peptidase (beta-lactamase class C family)
VLARVVEVAAQEPLDRFLQRRIFEPLGMSSTRFMLHEEEREELARVYTQDESRNLVRVDAPRGDVVGWTAGGGGLVSTAGDYMRFALMLWNRGSYDGARILSSESVELMTQPHVTDGVLEEWDIPGVGWGLGVAVILDADATPMIDRTGDFFWSGYLGTIFWVSPETDLVSVVMTQNEPGPYSPPPYAIYFAPALASVGL